MEYEFGALLSQCKETEWLSNLVIEIPLWSSITHVSIHCDSVATVVKACNQVYNDKFIQLDVIHSISFDKRFEQRLSIQV